MRRVLIIALLPLVLAVTLLTGASGQSFLQSSGSEGIDLDFENNRYWQGGATLSSTVGNFVTVSRASTGTNLIPTSASGFSYATFGSNIARQTSTLGLLVEEARTNQLLNSAVPVTQTTGALANGTYTLWVNGSGSATMSAGTATGCGTGVATNGTPVNFTTTGTAGTCTVTVAGSLNAFQLELGTFGTSLIVTTVASVTRAADVVTATTVPVFGSAYTLFAKGTPNSPTSNASNQYLLVVNNGGQTNRFGIFRRDHAFYEDVISSVLVGVGDFGSSWAQGTSAKLVAASQSGDQNAAYQGTLFGASAGVGSVPVSEIDIGARAFGLGQFNGYIERIALWPTTRIPNAQLQTQTTAVANDNDPMLAAIIDTPRRPIWANAR